MNILHLVSAKTWGGGEQYVYNLAKHQIQNGNSLFIVVDSRHKNTIERFQELKATIIELNLERSRFIKNALALRDLIRSNNIDCYNFHNGKLSALSVVVGKLSHCPVFFFKHNIVKGKNDLYHSWINKNLTRTICVSKAAFDAQIENLPQKLHEKFECLPNGIPIPDIVPAEYKQNDFTIGFSSRIVPHKGLQVLLEAVKQLNFPFELLIAGAIDSSFSQDLKNRYQSENIKFLGHQTDLTKFYSTIDAHVTPTLIAEPFGLVICEAMSFEKPVIATNQGGPLEIIRPEVDGLLIPANDVDALARAITYLYEHPDERQKWGKNARQRVIDNFSLDRLYKDLNRLYKSVIND